MLARKHALAVLGLLECQMVYLLKMVRLVFGDIALFCHFAITLICVKTIPVLRSQNTTRHLNTQNY